MKIVTENAIYIQWRDFKILKEHKFTIPKTIYAKFPEIAPTDRSYFDFIKFDNQLDIKYLKSLDCLVDYNEYKDLSLEELEKLMDEACENYNKNIDSSAALSDFERKKLHQIIESDDVRYCSLRDIYFYKQSDCLDFSLPSGVKYPSDHTTPLLKKIGSLFKKNR